MLELKRQAFHLSLGVLIVILLHFNIINLKFLMILLVLGIITSVLSRYIDIPLIKWFLERFDRKGPISGLGVITYFIGVILVLLFFEKNVALAGILVLALGDSLCHLGRFGKIMNPINKKKKLEGSLLGIIGATVGAMFLVKPLEAFLGSFFAMVFESLDIKFLGDNITVPLIAASVISLV